MMNRYNNENEAQYKKISEMLRQMPRVSAPDDFEAELKRRINMVESTSANGVKEKKKYALPAFSPFAVLTPLRRLLYPAAGLAAAALIYLTIPFGPSQQVPPSVQPGSNSPSLSQQSNTGAAGNQSLADASEAERTPEIKAERSNLVLPASERRAAEGQAAERQAAERQAPAEYKADERGFAAAEAVPQQSQQGLKNRLKQLALPGLGNDVDEGLRAKPAPYGPAYHEGTQNVNFGAPSVFPFEDEQYEQMKAKMDSIKKMMRSGRR